MIKYVDNYENLSKEKLVLNYNFENCKIITIKDLLLLNDINIDESLLCLLGTGLKIQFINFNYRKIYLWGLIGAEVECDRMILEKLNIPYMKMDKHKTAEFDFIELLTNKNIPLLFYFDGRYLRESKREIKKEDYISTYSMGMIVGVDSAKKQIYINLKKNEGKNYSMDFNSFIKSRESKMIPSSPDFLSYTINRIDDNQKRYIRENLIDIIATSIQETCINYLENPIKSNYEDICIVNGYDSYSALRECIMDFMNNASINDVDSRIYYKLAKFKVAFLRRTITFNTTNFFRADFGKGIIKYSEMIKNNKLKDIGEEFIIIGQRWRKFSRLLYSIDGFLNTKVCFLDNIVNEIEDISIKEKQVIKKLYEIIA